MPLIPDVRFAELCVVIIIDATSNVDYCFA